ncbi:C-type lectin domain family 7 member A isoform X2 [Chelonia mydas]|uniref:C-type lectin domain family 7 member A isoform X2 n=1 Tax=Chelonia mydas TaxID=8469 RepID=UPI0018A21A37|nr:C-type lectin domain family 7 member A isoform X2 [Chelonia mydas]
MAGPAPLVSLPGGRSPGAAAGSPGPWQPRAGVGEGSNRPPRRGPLSAATPRFLGDVGSRLASAPGRAVGAGAHPGDSSGLHLKARGSRWEPLLAELRDPPWLPTGLCMETKLLGVTQAPWRWSSGLCSLAVGAGILSTLMVIAVVVCTVWRIESSYPGCPHQWLGYRSSCYYFSKIKKDWNSSQASCSAEGSHLLMISDAKKMGHL